MVVESVQLAALVVAVAALLAAAAAVIVVHTVIIQWVKTAESVAADLDVNHQMHHHRRVLLAAVAAAVVVGVELVLEEEGAAEELAVGLYKALQISRLQLSWVPRSHRQVCRPPKLCHP